MDVDYRLAFDMAPVGLVLSILWGIDYAAELRARPTLTPVRRA